MHANPKVFISYSHDTDAHRKRVLQFAWALRDNGIDVELDQFHQEEIEDWPRWCNQMTSKRHSDFVLCICTEEYFNRVEGNVPPEKGKGVYWEGSLLDDDLYDEKRNKRLIPILFDNEPDTSIIRFLRGWTYCRIREFHLNDDGYELLVRILTRQSSVVKNALGEIPNLPTRQPATGNRQPVSVLTDISRIDKYAPEYLVGREAEKKLIAETWQKVASGETGRKHILAFVALGGEGKTSLVAKWLAEEMAGKDWPGCTGAFAWSFYSQGTKDQAAASSDLFLKEALLFFGNEKDKEFAETNAGAHEKAKRLAGIIGQSPNILVLDGVEPLQYPPSHPSLAGEFKDDGLKVLLKTLAANGKALCIVTSRYPLTDLKAFKQTTVKEEKLLRLSTEAGIDLLKKLGLTGPEKEFAALVEDVKGHALTLYIMGSYLVRAHRGDIRRRDRVNFAKADEKVDGGHAFHAMNAYVKWLEAGEQAAKRELAVLRLMGLFDRPASAGCMKALLQEPVISGLTEPLVNIAEEDWNAGLTSLKTAYLLTVNESEFGELLSLDTHPHIREYFARLLRDNHPETWRQAHKRLYEHLCETTKEGETPSLEELQPLYQAIAHGCNAGLYQETCDKVYTDRILKGTGHGGNYSTFMLGAIGADLGAIAFFFEQPWSLIYPGLFEPSKSWLFSEAAFNLRALGRLAEAMEPMRAGLKMYIQQETWEYAAIVTSNLSELQLILGKLPDAVRDGELAVQYADKSKDAFQRMAKRTTYADALHQSGKKPEALSLFREAEQMQVEDDPENPQLNSLGGFRYCDLLLVDVEQQSWLTCVNPPNKIEISNDESSTLSAVKERALYGLKIAISQNWLLDTGFDQLTLAKVALYAAILGEANLPEAVNELNKAVEALRRAGTQHYIPRGLLSRAWGRFLNGQKTGADSAQEDLDEAWEIAERGPMRLHMADIYLYRARLFFREPVYPWHKNDDGSPRTAKDDLRAAEKLINECGYHRRDKELEEAKKIIG